MPRCSDKVRPPVDGRRSTVRDQGTDDRSNDELTTLTAFLDFHRTVMLRTGSGLTPDQLATTIAGT